MTRDVQITLISPVMTEDEYGIPQPGEPERVDVLAGCESVSASEFFEAGRNGLRPEFRFTLFFGDYDGQRIVEYNGKQYTVYRTYMGKSDTVELYVQQKGATNG